LSQTFATLGKEVVINWKYAEEWTAKNIEWVKTIKM
tara:strand:- start:118 stop:225 length:108 start_codon:yes stop_codon:yes gene_type:complete